MTQQASGLPLQLDLVIARRSRFMLVVAVTVDWLTDLTGFSPHMQIRQFKTSADTLADWTSYVSVQGAQSTVTIDLPADMSQVAAWDRGHYDIVLTNGTPAQDVRVLQGVITLDKEVTR